MIEYLVVPMGEIVNKGTMQKKSKVHLKSSLVIVRLI